MSARVHVRDDFMFGRVMVGVRLDGDRFIQWGEQTVSTLDPMVVQPDDAWLPLDEAVARALLDALAAHFGAGTDLASLRRDYNAERSRVDKFIAHLTERAS